MYLCVCVQYHIEKADPELQYLCRKTFSNWVCVLNTTFILREKTSLQISYKHAKKYVSLAIVAEINHEFLSRKPIFFKNWTSERPGRFENNSNFRCSSNFMSDFWQFLMKNILNFINIIVIRKGTTTRTEKNRCNIFFNIMCFR